MLSGRAAVTTSLEYKVFAVKEEFGEVAQEQCWERSDCKVFGKFGGDQGGGTEHVVLRIGTGKEGTEWKPNLRDRIPT